MRRALRPAALACLLALPGAASAEGGGLDLAVWAAGLPERFVVSGQKTEPTYQLQTDMARRGDVFAVLGGAPAHSARALVRVALEGEGIVVALPCPEGARCGTAHGARGHLATAALVAASRAGRLSGRVEPVAHGPHEVVCVAGEMLGIVAPILDPCFERMTGAAIAQRHRTSGRLEGPTLDPLSVRIHGPDAPLPEGLILDAPARLADGGAAAQP